MGIGFTGQVGPGFGDHNNAARIQGELLGNQDRVVDGASVSKPEGDASGLNTEGQVQRVVDRVEVSDRTVEDGLRSLESAESDIDEAAHLLNRLRDLAVRAGDKELTREEQQTIVTEFEEARQELDQFSPEEISLLELPKNEPEAAPLRDDAPQVEARDSADDTSSALDVDTTDAAAAVLPSIEEALDHIEEQRGILTSAQDDLKANFDAVVAARLSQEGAQVESIDELVKAVESANDTRSAIVQGASVAGQLHGLSGETLQDLLYTE